MQRLIDYLQGVEQDSFEPEGLVAAIFKQTKNIDLDDSAFNKVEAIIFSMTPEERNNPE